MRHSFVRDPKRDREYDPSVEGTLCLAWMCTRCGLLSMPIPPYNITDVYAWRTDCDLYLVAKVMEEDVSNL